MARRALIIILAIIAALTVAFFPTLLNNLGITPTKPEIDDQWVSSFIAQINSYRTKPLSESSTLDHFASIRFSTIVAHYQITHYGFDQDFYSFFAGQSIAAEEEYFFPEVDPAAFALEIQKTAPAHWQGLIDPKFTHIGYYIGTGPTIEVFQPCSFPSEITGSINETQQLIQDGCRYEVVTGTYLVIELSD
jgi:uncharacterized protein YkwD